MNFCYQAATPDVAAAPSVTAFQGRLKETFAKLSAIGYDGVELMTLDPDRLDWNSVKNTAAEYGLVIPLVCTGEIFGQLGLSFTHPEESIRREAISRVKRIIDFASFLGANINIGRVRGQYCDEIERHTTYQWAVNAFREISFYAHPKQVAIALEPVTIMQTNFINTAAEAAQMADDVNADNFGIMFDVFHLNIEEQDMLRAMRDFARYNIHIHLADNNRRYPGQCGMDFEKIIQTIYDTGYDKTFATEIYQFPDQETAAAGSMKHLAPIFHKIYGRTPKGSDQQ